MSEEEIYKALGYSAQPFGYSNDELQRIADGEKVFPHVFGTDRYGRDIMVRTMFATRVSMIIGLTAALIVLVIGARSRLHLRLLRRYGGCGHAAHRGRYLLPA